MITDKKVQQLKVITQQALKIFEVFRRRRLLLF